MAGCAVLSGRSSCAEDAEDAEEAGSGTTLKPQTADKNRPAYKKRHKIPLNDHTQKNTLRGDKHTIEPKTRRYLDDPDAVPSLRFSLGTIRPAVPSPALPDRYFDCIISMTLSFLEKSAGLTSSITPNTSFRSLNEGRLVGSSSKAGLNHNVQGSGQPGTIWQWGGIQLNNNSNNNS